MGSVFEITGEWEFVLVLVQLEIFVTSRTSRLASISALRMAIIAGICFAGLVLSPLLASLRRRYVIPLFSVVVLLAISMVVVFVATKQPSVYTSSTHMSLSPRAGAASVGADTLELAATRYSALIAAPAAANSVSQEVGVSPSEARNAVTVMVPPKTVTISVSATSTLPELTSRLANAFAHIALERAKGDPLVSLDLVATAVTPQEPSGPHRMFILAGGLVGAFLCAVGAAWGLIALRNRYVVERD